MKRQASDNKTSSDVKKQRLSPPSKDKKSSVKSTDQKSKPKDVQAIKEQLRLVESALNKKKANVKQ
jgi:hypothetical protein